MLEQARQDIERDPVQVRAAEWFLRLDDPQVSLEETLEWQRWMQADARHAQAFVRMEEAGKVLREMKRPEIGQAPLTLALSPRWGERGGRLALAASVAAVATGVLWYLNDAPGVVQTAVGENRSLRLEDGSRITLGGGTQLRVSFDDQSRHIELSHGEAFFVVAREAARPFTVNAGDATVRAVGTEFNVRRGRDRVVVAVVEGRVMVEPVASPAGGAARREPLRLDAGQQTTIDAAGMAAPARLANPDTATAWRSGRLIFRGEPLRHVVEDVNRYAAKPVMLGDAALGDFRFTGTVLNDNVGGWIASLESVFGLEAVEERGRIVLRGKAPSL
jgi:transmembrane sensor